MRAHSTSNKQQKGNKKKERKKEKVVKGWGTSAFGRNQKLARVLKVGQRATKVTQEAARMQCKASCQGGSWVEGGHTTHNTHTQNKNKVKNQRKEGRVKEGSRKVLCCCCFVFCIGGREE